MVQIDVSFTKFGSIKSFICLEDFESSLAALLPSCVEFTLDRIRIGNEFCERLIPSANDLKKTIELADRRRLEPVLVLANLTDRGQEKACRILTALSRPIEIIVNDWGSALLIAERFPQHTLIAGRLMCKHLKEARISKPKEPLPANWPVKSTQFVRVLGGLGIRRAEVDLAPHTYVPEEKTTEIALTLHLGRGYSAKSHVCRVGSTNLANDKKFIPGHLCRRECLDYEITVSKLHYPKNDGMRMFQRGNTWFYRYTDDMNSSIASAFKDGLIDRAVVTMD